MKRDLCISYGVVGWCDGAGWVFATSFAKNDFLEF